MFVLCSGHISRREPAQNQIWCFGYGYSECQEKSGYSRRKLDRKQQMIIKTYRQDLRNFINDNKEKILNGEKIEFPKQPDFIDLNIIY